MHMAFAHTNRHPETAIKSTVLINITSRGLYCIRATLLQAMPKLALKEFYTFEISPGNCNRLLVNHNRE